ESPCLLSMTLARRCHAKLLAQHGDRRASGGHAAKRNEVSHVEVAPPAHHSDHSRIALCSGSPGVGRGRSKYRERSERRASPAPCPGRRRASPRWVLELYELEWIRRHRREWLRD